MFGQGLQAVRAVRTSAFGYRLEEGLGMRAGCRVRRREQGPFLPCGSSN